MDRKVKYRDRPAHHRWLYHLSDYGLVKAILLILGVSLLIIVIALGLVKLMLVWFKH